MYQAIVLLLYVLCIDQQPHPPSGSVFHEQVSGHRTPSLFGFTHPTGGEQHAKLPRWNDNAMTEQGWRAVLTITLEICTGADQTLAAHLATAVQALDVPSSVLERLRQALTTAMHRAFQRDGTRLVRVTMSTRVIQPQAMRTSCSWGFFLVERTAEDTQHQQIEVFLYPDGS
jgi:hypothetical protein